MAYISQTQKKEKELKIKPILKKYGMSGRLSVRNNTTLVLNISKGKLNFYSQWEDSHYKKPEIQEKWDYLSVNPYWYKTQFFGESLEFLSEIMDVMNEGNYDNSEPQIDYFERGWYVNLNIGTWNKPYLLTE